MKKLWNLVSIIAVVNLLAVLGFGGWLWTSGRMDKERFRTLLEPPPPVAPPAEEAPPPEPEADLTPTSLKIDAGERQLRKEAMGLRRIQEEKEQLDRVLDERERTLTAEKSEFDAERQAWEASMADTKAAKTDEQFRKAVKLLENVPAKQGKEWILELVKGGQTDQAVAYLDAMSSFKATGLLKAFKGEEETKVATELLEKLRQRTPSAKPLPKESGTAAGGAQATPPSSTQADAATPTRSPAPAASPTPAGAKQPVADKPAAGKQPGNGSDGKPAVPAGKPVANSGAAVDEPAAGSGTKPSGSR